MEQEIICSICGVKVKYFTDIGQFLEKEGLGWHGSILNQGGEQYEFWYCPTHSVKEANDFERQTMRKSGIEQVIV